GGAGAGDAGDRRGAIGQLAAGAVRHEAAVREAGDVDARRVDIDALPPSVDQRAEPRDVVGTAPVEIAAGGVRVPELATVRVGAAVGRHDEHALAPPEPPEPQPLERDATP